MASIQDRTPITGELLARPALREVVTREPVKPFTVLVVEDDPTMRLAIGCIISDGNCRVVLTSGAEEALERLWDIDPDVIICDFMLGGMTGREFCATLRASHRWRYIPIIVVTSLNAESVIADLLRSGADDVMLKPVRGEELRARIAAGRRRRRNYLQLGCEAEDRALVMPARRVDITV